MRLLGDFMKKHIFYKEIAYLCAVSFIAFGVALAAKADFGVSMISGPMYTIYLWASQFTDIITVGTLEYILQGLVIALLVFLTRNFKVSYLFSFATSVFSGLMIDLSFIIVEPFLADTLPIRIAVFAASLISCAIGVAFIFHSYIAPAGNELFVKVFSEHFKKDINKVKIAYDASFLIISIVLNLLLFRGFVAIGIGTVLTAVLNGVLIGKVSAILEKHLEFKAAFPKLEKYFTK